MPDLSKFKVVISDSMHVPFEIEKATFAEANLVPEIHACVSEEETIAACRDAHGIVNGFAPFTRKVIEQLENCKIIARCGIGYDNVDVQACTDHGIYLTNLPGYCAHEVADHTLAMLLAINRKIVLADQNYRKYDWAMNHLAPVLAFQGRTLGLIGFGHIGSLFAKRVAAMECDILVFDPYISAESVEKLGYRYATDIEQIYKESDFISLLLPYTKDSHNIINKQSLAKMKKSAIIINTARGKLIDEEALAEALKNGSIGGAAIDVFEHELPPQELASFKKRMENYKSPLMELGPDKVVLTPHESWYSDRAFVKLKEIPCREVMRVLAGEKPLGAVNGKALENK